MLAPMCHPFLRRLATVVALLLGPGSPAAGADAGALAALQAERPATLAEAMQYADVLARADRGDDAERLRAALLTGYLDALEGRPVPPARSVGEWLARAATPPSGGDALAARWARTFERHVTVRWAATLPGSVAGVSPAPRPLARGAWVAGTGDRVQLVAAFELVNGLPDAITLPGLQLWAGPPDAGIGLACQPADADPIDRPVAPGAARAFTCRGGAPAAGAAMLARAADGRLAAGERLELAPTHLTRAGGLAALTAALAGTGPRIDAEAWVARLRAVPAARPAAAAASSSPAVAPAPRAAPAPAPRPQAAPAWRTTMAVAGSAAALLLLARLLFGHLAEVSPARTLLTSLPPMLALLLAGALLGSPAGQAMVDHATGRGLRDFALALQAAGDTSPKAWRLDEVWLRVWRRWGFFGAAAVLGGAVFALERALERASLGAGTVLTLSMLVRLVAVAPLAAAGGAGGTVGVAFTLVAVAVFGFSLAVTMALRRATALLDDEGIGWAATVRRGFAGTLDWRGTATRAEFWGFAAFALLAWGGARLALPPWDAAVALLLAPPMLALVVRRWRALDAGALWGLAGLVLLAVLELAVR